MASFFAWLDFSEHERRKMLDVISQFREQDTRDELGIGMVRDAFADLLFPGTSTIQTRARYFLFVPWIYLDLERRKTTSNQIISRARQKEITLINALAASDDPDGTIGIQARQTLQRLPSNIYWQGLGTLGIRLFLGSQDQYHRYLDTFHSSGERNRRNDDGEPVEGKISYNWHTGLPPVADGFPEKAFFRLAKREAEYLHERIMARIPRTLFAFLVDHGREMDPIDFPWQHPKFGDFPSHIREQLDHGRNFSEVIHGAALLYNLMLAEQGKLDDRINEYQGKIQNWVSVIKERQDVLMRWERKRFWEIVISGNARVTHPTRLFINTWLDIVLSSQNLEEVKTNKQAQQLIHERERLLKRGLARLDNPRALEQWNGAAGTQQLNYRWPVTQTIVSDILKGLSEGRADA